MEALEIWLECMHNFVQTDEAENLWAYVTQNGCLEIQVRKDGKLVSQVTCMGNFYVNWKVLGE